MSSARRGNTGGNLKNHHDCAEVLLPAKEGGRRLAESERQFRLLIQNVTEYAIYMLDTQGRIATWNPGG